MTVALAGTNLRTPAATSGTARDINRRLVLKGIRNRQPVSRADLARLTGLQRSTVSLIVEELISDAWVLEGPTGRLPRGRRPTYVRLNEDRMICGIDIRPVDTTLAMADVNGQFSSLETFPTAKTQDEGIGQIAARVKKLREAHRGRPFEGAGVSVPGRVDTETGRLVFAPNLGWKGGDLRSRLERATGLNVSVENAANACALAEVWFGSNAAGADMIAITVSEGIGAGIFANGQLVRGPDGMAGEFGHMLLDARGPECGCGHRGCWEACASNSAALRYYLDSEPMPAGPSFQHVLALGRQGDERARLALQKQADYLGLGASILANGLAPAAIVFIGELANLWQVYRPAIENQIAARSVCARKPRVLAAGDGAQARLRGTVALVLEKHFGSSAVSARGSSS